MYDVAFNSVCCQSRLLSRGNWCMNWLYNRSFPQPTDPESTDCSYGDESVRVCRLIYVFVVRTFIKALVLALRLVC